MRSTTRLFLLASLALVGVVVIPYLQVAGFDFVLFDDDVYVTTNPMVRAGLTLAGLRWAFTSVCAAAWHPLTLISLMTDVSCFGVNPGAMHAVNLLLHLASAILLLAVLNRLTGSLGAAWIATALWALHPLRVESVVWVCQRKDVLSMFFGLGATLCYLRGLGLRTWPVGKEEVVSPGVSARESAWWHLSATLLFVFAFLAKPSVVMFPFLAAMLEYMVNGRVRWRNLELLFWVSVAGMLITFYTQSVNGAMMPTSIFPLKIRLMNALSSIGIYYSQMLYPTKLAIFYPLSLPISLSSILFGGTAVTVLALAIWHTGFSGRAKFIGPVCRDKALNTQSLFPYAAALGWFLVAILPMLGIIQVGGHAHADRFTYWPSIGIALVVAWGLLQIVTRVERRARLVVWVFSGCVIGMLIFLTTKQVSHWRNTESIMSWSASVTEHNFVAEGNLGYDLCLQGRPQEGVSHLRLSIEYAPSPQALCFYAWGLTRLGQWSDAAKIAEHVRGQTPEEPHAWIVLGAVAGHRGAFEEAKHLLIHALSMNVADPMAWHELGCVFSGQQRWMEAVTAWRHACDLYPGYPPSVECLRQASGHIDRARIMEWQALLVEPRSGMPAGF